MPKKNSFFRGRCVMIGCTGWKQHLPAIKKTISYCPLPEYVFPFIQKCGPFVLGRKSKLWQKRCKCPICTDVGISFFSYKDQEGLVVWHQNSKEVCSKMFSLLLLTTPLALAWRPAPGLVFNSDRSSNFFSNF